MAQDYGFGKAPNKPRGPYGTNVGDIWTMEGSNVGDRLTAEGMIGIWEVFPNEETGKPEERMYSIALDNPDPGMQELITKARKGDELYRAAKAAQN